MTTKSLCCYPNPEVFRYERLTATGTSGRLQQLVELIRNGHKAATKAHSEWIEAVRLTGFALIEAKRRCKHRKKWSQWRQTHIVEGLGISKRTCQDYVQVANNWEWLDKKRQEGVRIDSVNAALTVVREAKRDRDREKMNEHKKFKPKPTRREEEHANNQKGIIKTLTAWAKTFDDTEADVMAEPGLLANVLDEMRQKIHHIAEAIYGEYDDEQAEANDRDHREACRLVSSALNV